MVSEIAPSYVSICSDAAPIELLAAIVMPLLEVYPADASNLPPSSVNVPPGMFVSAATETVPAAIVRAVEPPELVPLNTNVPAPFAVNVCAPVTAPLAVVVMPESTLTFASPVNVSALVSVTPDVEESSNVVPAPSVIAPVVGIAFAFPILSVLVPPSVVPPVYVFAAVGDKLRMPVPATDRLHEPDEPDVYSEITPVNSNVFAPTLTVTAALAAEPN